MSKFKFNLEDGLADGERPQVIKESFQVFECTWLSELEEAYNDKPGNLEGYEGPYRNFNGITSKFGAHFILKIDKILMKEKYYNGIIKGVKASSFPRVPVDYGYRDSTHFWMTKFIRPHKEPIPAAKEADLGGVVYAANRMDDNIKFTEEACKTIVKVPRVFLKLVLQGCIDWARENNVTLITEEHMKIIQDKRNKEKKKR